MATKPHNIIHHTTAQTDITSLWLTDQSGSYKTKIIILVIEASLWRLTWSFPPLSLSQNRPGQLRNIVSLHPALYTSPRTFSPHQHSSTLVLLTSPHPAFYTCPLKGSCSVQLSGDSCRLHIDFIGRTPKTRFRIFMLHSCLRIILDGAQNIPIFSRYFWQHYRKIKLQFDVLKLRKRKRIATHINNCDDVMAGRGCVQTCTLLQET